MSVWTRRATSGELRAAYDARYAGSYRTELRGYERARAGAFASVLRARVRPLRPGRVLDFGCGSGLFWPVVGSALPGAELCGADISRAALDRLREERGTPAERALLVEGAAIPAADASFDAAVSVETLEHVEDLAASLREVRRVLRPGAPFVFTTPCANVGSLEHALTVLRGQVERSPTGERRWSWEDPAHLRRLTSGELGRALTSAGFGGHVFRYRAHAMSYVCTPLVGGRWRGTAERLMGLEWRLLRWAPMGASVVATTYAGGAS